LVRSERNSVPLADQGNHGPGGDFKEITVEVRHQHGVGRVEGRVVELLRADASRKSIVKRGEYLELNSSLIPP
jgi:hypothetical protein